MDHKRARQSLRMPASPLIATELQRRSELTRNANRRQSAFKGEHDDSRGGYR
jgi:hypothetical protein